MKDLRDIIRAGGYTEGDNTSKSLDDLRIFTSDTGKMSLYPDEASAPKSGAPWPHCPSSGCPRRSP